ncbi:DUF1566 domain-containing protein [Parachitinimonas caeni]|uniref:DUF1566 domain-containing protein n=1 Tax=Parachitinimonas caeni TaxID=3031301 RepID=A0ABT7DW44_9NEIS|nr:DUF1566 domain-containing protein [Parachitinimonas caeni]MDK2124281.1 DUF1566 domain-containing protein [Parachitinimonas caeni]
MTLRHILAAGAGLSIALAMPNALATVQVCNPDIVATTPTSNFIDHGDGTVTHQATGLMWMRCSIGQTWSGGSCANSATTMDWQTALSAAAATTYASKTDWRLPNLKELESIVERKCYGPATNQTIFPSFQNADYWTSTTAADAPSNAWSISMGDGFDSSSYAKSLSKFVHLVRSGFPSDRFDRLASSFDPSPALVFPNAWGSPPSTWIFSTAQTLNGTTTPTPISITGPGFYSTDNGVSFTNKPGFVEPGAQIVLKGLSGSPPADLTSMTLKVGTLQSIFEIAVAPSTMPSATIVPATSLVSATNSTFTVNFDLAQNFPSYGQIAIQFPAGYVISGAINYLDVSISGAGISSAISTSRSGQTLVINTSGSGSSGTSSVSVSINNSRITNPSTQGNQIFSISTNLNTGQPIETGTATTTVGPPNTTPNPFTFSAKTNVARNVAVESAAATILGITGPASISVAGGEYKINAGTFTTSPGSVNNGDTVTVRHTSSSLFSTTVVTTLTVDTFSTTFSSVTEAAALPTSGTFTVPCGASADLAGPGTVTLGGGSSLTVGAAANGSVLKIGSSTDPCNTGSSSTPRSLSLSLGGFNLAVLPTSPDTELAIATTTFNGAQIPVVRLVKGSATFSGAANQPLLVTAGGAVVRSGNQSARIAVSVNANGGYSIVVLSGNLLFPCDRRCPPGAAGLTMEKGETATFSAEGVLSEIIVEDSADPLAAGNLRPLPPPAGLSFDQTPVNLEGGSPRLGGQRLDDALTQLVNDSTSLGLKKQGQQSYGALGFNYNFIKVFAQPVGRLTADPSAGTSLRGDRQGVLVLSVKGVVTRLVPGLADPTVVLSLMRQTDPAATLRVTADGVLRVVYLGKTYAVRPGWWQFARNKPASFSVEPDGSLLFTDFNGRAQTLYPFVADFKRMDEVMRLRDSNAQLFQNTDGTIAVTLQGLNYTFTPDIGLVDTPSVHLADDWWVEPGKFYVRYLDGKSQGFFVQ